MPNYDNAALNLTGAIQAKIRRTIATLRMMHAPTRDTFTSGRGARKESASLVGLRIPYNRTMAHGSSALDPFARATSFEPYVAPLTASMYVGLAFLGVTVMREWFHSIDMDNGNLPITKEDVKRQAMATYMIERNWDAIGDDDATGSVAVVTTGAATPSAATITLASDNNGRGRSKGSIRLAVSPSTDAADRIVYQSYNPSTNALTCTFYVVSKPNATQAVVTTTDAGTIGTNDVIVKKGHYKKVPYGIGYHSNPAMTYYQGADVSSDSFLKPTGIDAGDEPINPSLIHSAKSIAMTDANNTSADIDRIAHMTISNYNALAEFDYDLRTVDSKDGFKGTHGKPFKYTDGDTYFALDANYEEGQVDFRDADSYFEYRQTELREVSKGETQYVGTNMVGSTEFYQNWGESYNLAYDGRGDDGMKGKKGAPNSMVRIYNIAHPDVTQVSRGKSLF